MNVVQENVEATKLSVIPSKEMNSNYDDGSIDITQEHINEIPDSLKNDLNIIYITMLIHTGILLVYGKCMMIPKTR